MVANAERLIRYESHALAVRLTNVPVAEVLTRSAARRAPRSAASRTRPGR